MAEGWVGEKVRGAGRGEGGGTEISMQNKKDCFDKKKKREREWLPTLNSVFSWCGSVRFSEGDSSVHSKLLTLGWRDRNVGDTVTPAHRRSR